jgi:hypothetical protein
VRLQLELEQLREQIRAQAPEYAELAFPRAAAPVAVQAGLKPGEALLEFAVLDAAQRIVCFVVTPSSFASVRCVEGESEFRRTLDQVETLHGLLRRADSDAGEFRTIKAYVFPVGVKAADVKLPEVATDAN